MRTNFNFTHSKRAFTLGSKTKKIITTQLGTLLKNEREKLNIKIEDLSKMLKMNVKTISQIEKGTQKTHYLAIAILLKFYKKKIKLTLIDEKSST